MNNTNNMYPIILIIKIEVEELTCDLVKLKIKKDSHNLSKM